MNNVEQLSSAIQINLLPEDLRVSERRIPRLAFDRVLPIIAACALIGGLGGVAYLEERSIRTTAVEVSALQIERAQLAPLEARLTVLRAQRIALQRKLALVQQLSQGRNRAASQVDALPAVLPERLWLSDVTITDSLRATIMGVALSPLTVADLVARLDSTACFRGASLIMAEAGKINDTPVTRFVVRCGLIP